MKNFSNAWNKNPENNRVEGKEGRLRLACTIPFSRLVQLSAERELLTRKTSTP